MIEDRSKHVLFQNQSCWAFSTNMYSVISVIIIVYCPQVYEIKLGTVDQNEADVEWRLRPYMNTSKKRKMLSS